MSKKVTKEEYFHRYAKARNKYMKDYDKNKKLLYRKYSDANNLYRWQCPKSCLQMALNDMKIFMNLKKNSQKTKLIKMMKDNFSKLMFNNL